MIQKARSCSWWQVRALKTVSVRRSDVKSTTQAVTIVQIAGQMTL